MESYPVVADLVVRPDPSVLKHTVLFAGLDHTFLVPLPDGDDQVLAVYFMFTEPQQDWKTPVAKPRPGLKITLGSNNITEVLNHRNCWEALTETSH